MPKDPRRPVDKRKLALANQTRVRRSAQRRLIKNNVDPSIITNEMISSHLAQRDIDRMDAMSRKSNNNQNQYKGSVQRKHPTSFVNQLPYKPLKKHVLWLSCAQQDAHANVSLTKELEYFADYVKVWFDLYLLMWLFGCWQLWIVLFLTWIETIVQFQTLTVGCERRRSKSEHAVGYQRRSAEPIPTCSH